MAAEAAIAHTMSPFVWAAAMKWELTPIEKLLRRKQRMYVLQAISMLVLHKKYFSKQSKRLRCQNEVAHGQTWFYGNVDVLARKLENQNVQSEDDEFFDKRFVVMEDIYILRRRALVESGECDENDLRIVDLIIHNMVHVMCIIPNGDVFIIHSRCNPSGSDATTENNCIARKLFETYAQLRHDYDVGIRTVYRPLKATLFLGDDRIAGMASYTEGYADAYIKYVTECGVRLKTLVTTDGPLGAEFCGFKIVRAWWDIHTYAPHYSLDRLFAGLFIPIDEDLNVSFSRFTAMSLLFYPHKETYRSLKPHIVAFCQMHPKNMHAQIALDFWVDEDFLKFMWTGKESKSIFSPRCTYNTYVFACELVEEAYCDSKCLQALERREELGRKLTRC